MAFAVRPFLAFLFIFCAFGFQHFLFSSFPFVVVVARRRPFGRRGRAAYRQKFPRSGRPLTEYFTTRPFRPLRRVGGGRHFSKIVGRSKILFRLVRQLERQQKLCKVLGFRPARFFVHSHFQQKYSHRKRS